MPDIAITTLLWLGAIGCGLVAGLYFTFSAFAMRALASIDPAAGVAAMNAINVEILRSAFMPLFLGTSLIAGVLAIAGMLGWGQPGSAAMVIGGLGYVVGMTVVTMLANVPLNDQLAAAAPPDPHALALWADYLKRWTAWNHVRTVASTGAMAAFIQALAAR